MLHLITDLKLPTKLETFSNFHLLHCSLSSVLFSVAPTLLTPTTTLYTIDENDSTGHNLFAPVVFSVFDIDGDIINPPTITQVHAQWDAGEMTLSETTN